MSEHLASSKHRSLTHIAIIMDGNGRWARMRGPPRSAGHHRGAKAVRRAISGAIKLGVPYLTLYGFSAENWQRPVFEVNNLMGLLRRYLQSDLSKLHAEEVRFQVIGQREQLPSDIVQLISDAEELTRQNDRLALTLALSYGGLEWGTRCFRRPAKAQAGRRRRPFGKWQRPGARRFKPIAAMIWRVKSVSPSAVGRSSVAESLRITAVEFLRMI